MSFAPKVSLIDSPDNDQSAISALETAGDKELPDANLTEDRRRTLRAMTWALAWHLTPIEIIYLAGALETEANTKRAAEGCSGSES